MAETQTQKLFGTEVPVRRCPYIKAGAQGIVHMKPELIKELAGLVQDPDEWALLIIGRSEGVETWAESFEVPSQARGKASVDVDDIEVNGEFDFIDGKMVHTPSPIVGVIHSHDNMGAFFSGTDENKLNPRFPLSIVIAQGKEILGFQYKAEMRHKLPCGSLGIIPCDIQPFGVEWPWIEKAHWPTEEEAAEELKTDDFGDCKKFKLGEAVDTWWVDETADCGLQKRFPLASAFGRSTDLMPTIIERSRKITRTPPISAQKPKSQTQLILDQNGNEVKPESYDPYMLTKISDDDDLDEYTRFWLERTGGLDAPEQRRSRGALVPITDEEKKRRADAQHERWAFNNEYTCQKCKSEWSDVGSLMEESFCEKCEDFEPIKPWNSQRKETTGIEIKFTCLSCFIEGTFFGGWAEFTHHPCTACGKETLNAVSADIPLQPDPEVEKIKGKKKVLQFFRRNQQGAQ